MCAIRGLWYGKTPMLLLATFLLSVGTACTTVSGENGEPVPGIITWEGNEVVSSDMEVGPDQTLVIKPGSNVIFENNATLLVTGTLFAVAEPGRPILLDGNLNFRLGPELDGQEYYIMVSGSSVVLKGASADGSVVDGITISSLRIVLEGTSPLVSNSSFMDNSELLVLGNGAPTVRDNRFVNNGVGEPSLPWYDIPYAGWRSDVWPSSTMVCMGGSEARVVNNTFFRNGGFGLVVEDALPVIVGNTFDSNRLGGIRVDLGGIAEGTLMLEDNLMINHGTVADGVTVVEDPTTPPEGPVGLLLLNGSAWLVGNRFEDNEIGLVCVVYAGGGPWLEGNSLTGNEVGIYSQGGSVQVLECYLDRNDLDLWLSGSADVELVNTTVDEGRVLVVGDEEEVPLKAPVTPAPLMGVLVLIGLAGSVAAGSTEVGRYRLFALAYPLYAKVRGQKVLDHFLRGQIYGLIRGRPGIHYSKIKRVLEVGNGVLAYHLEVLEREGFIKTQRLGSKKLFYPTKLPYALRDLDDRFPKGEEPVCGIPLSDLQEQIVALVSERPGILQVEIARELGVSKQRVNYNMRSLVLAEVITVVWDSNRTRCYPRDWDAKGVD